VKTLILGDIHGLSTWKEIINQEKDLGRIIFMGDYFDSFDIPGIEQLYNFNEIIRFKESTEIPVIMLIGNHDHHYMGVGETYSGYQPAMQWDIQHAIKTNLDHLQIAYKLDDLIFTHAGISPIWLDNTFGWNGWNKGDVIEKLNDLYKFRPIAFNFSHGGFSGTGDSTDQGPLWIRPRSLMKSNSGDNGFKKNFIQIVGHTIQNDIFSSFKTSEKSMGGKYYVVDALHSGGYVIYENGKLTPKEI